MAIYFALLISSMFQLQANADYLGPNSPYCSGIHDLMLIYANENTKEAEWRQKDFTYYVYHLDENGNPDDWFFDGFLLLAQTTPDGANTQASLVLPHSNMKGWLWFVDLIFTKDRFIDALDKTVSDAPRKLPKAPARKVVIMIPYPGPYQNDFGDIDNDGFSEDFSSNQERVKVVKWYVNIIIDRWRAMNPKHLELAGFYWMDESLPHDAIDVIKQTGDYVRSMGYRLFWIPYFAADPNTSRWMENGFDCAVKQPNYFFPQWHAERSRVNKTGKMAKRQGMGVEIEFDDSIFAKPEEYYPKFLRYLNAGVEEGFMSQSFHAFYQSYITIRKFYTSDDPRFRSLYDRVYDFTKGKYSITPERWEIEKK